MKASAPRTRLFVLYLSLISFYLLFNPLSLLSNEIAPGQTGEVTITKYGVGATVSSVLVGDALGDNAKYIASSTSGTWAQNGSTLTIKFDVTLTNDAPAGESISVYFMVLIMTSGSISNIFPRKM